MSWKAEAIFEQALIAVRGRDYDRALALLVMCLAEKPDLAEAWVMRGNILLSLERFFDAILHFDRAIALRDEAYDAWNNRGTALANLGRWDLAEQAFRKSAAIMPASEPHMGLANMFCTLMRLDEAAAEYQAALACDPSDHEAQFNLGVTLLGLGRWPEGFKCYEHRWLNTPHPPAAYRNFAKWQGENLEGKTILLYGEQGYGDEIMAARFASELCRRRPGARVVLEARAPFARIARSLAGIEVITRGDPYPAGVDYSCPLLDVPMVLGMEPRDVKYGAGDGSYLNAAPTFEDRIKAMPPGLNVGLCWSSGKHLSTSLGARAMKSIPIEMLKGFVMPGVNLISLQKPAEPTPPGMNVHDWTDELGDLADTASLIASLDLVISVDTAVAHLAGALGKPVWNFVRFSGYWPWRAESPDNGEDSTWYPTMRLLRQPSLNDWSIPIATAVRDLNTLVKMEKAA